MNQNAQFRNRQRPQRPQRTAIQTAIQKYFAQDFFIYVIPFTAALAPGAQTSNTVTLDADSDFLWQKMTVYADVGDDAQTASSQVLAGVTLVITDSGSGRKLMNTGVPIAAMAGDGKLPFIIPTPKIFKASGQIEANIANITDNATYSSLYLCFVGQKCFLKASPV